VTEGSYVPVAVPGCYLPVIDLKIEPRKLRGEDSNGMICSKGELGIKEDEEQHWIWTLQYAAGTDLSKVPQQPDFDDITDEDCGIPLKQKYPRLEAYIFDVDNKTVTHRPDLTGHFGIAWELNAMYAPSAKDHISRSKLPTLMDAHTYTSINEMVAHGKTHNIHADVDTDAVQVYSTILLEDCTVQPSSFLPRMILRDCGHTPKNNWVDFSNLTMIMTGQPIHCFDADKIQGSIHVRYAKE
jgi:phenylalanyl-tRNA synthetase beta chain